MHAYRKIVVVTEADMMQAPLYAQMTELSDRRVKTMKDSINKVCDERSEYESTRERIKDGVLQIAQSDDIKFVDALKDHDAFARMLLALKINPREYVFPQSLDGGKTSSQTSNLKSYNKARQVAEVIFSNSTDLEGVARVFAVCAYRFASSGVGVITREYCKDFLSSREFTGIDTATADLWSKIDDIRAKQITGGAETQSGQMVRTLVALKSASDVRDGRAKNVAIDTDGLVMRALMIRLGQPVQPLDA